MNARDNRYCECPSLMNYSTMTDRRMPNRREQYIMRTNGIVRDDEYRMFLQQNTDIILENEWNYYKKNYSCFPNQCIHNQPLTPPPVAHTRELQEYNLSKLNPENRQMCTKMEDYRMTKKSK